MPRGGSRGGSRSSSRSPPPRSTNTATRPQQQPAQQQQTQSGGGLLGGIGSTIMQGFAFGTGSAIAHNAVRSMMGGSSDQQVQEQQGQQEQYASQSQPCQTEINNFSQCLQRNDDLSYCQNFADMLKICKKDHNLA